MARVNNIVYKPSTRPGLTQDLDPDFDIKCNANNLPKSCENSSDLCSCTHIMNFEKDKCHEIVLIDNQS